MGLRPSIESFDEIKGGGESVKESMDCSLNPVMKILIASVKMEHDSVYVKNLTDTFRPEVELDSDGNCPLGH